MKKLNNVMRRFNMEKPNKADFQVYDKHLDTDGSYKKLGEGTWYNNYMYQRALNAYNIRKSHDGDLEDVSNGPKCNSSEVYHSLEMGDSECGDCFHVWVGC
ncbi:MAG: hypothetical protein RLP12_12745 [Ekhidna sp.]